MCDAVLYHSNVHLSTHLARVHVVHGPGVAAAGHAILSNSYKYFVSSEQIFLIRCEIHFIEILPPTCQHHPLLQALLEAAELAAVALGLVDLAVAVGHAGVDPLVLHRALEEALAALTCDDAVVEPGGLRRYTYSVDTAQILELETKVKRRSAKISQSPRRPLPGSFPSCKRPLHSP